MISTKTTWKYITNKDVQYCVDLCALAVRDLYGLNLPRFYMHSTRKTAGLCCMEMWDGRYIDSVILLSDALIGLPLNDIMNTVVHEVAHFVANTRYGYNCGHNSQWYYVGRKIAIEVGLAPDTITQYIQKGDAVLDALRNKAKYMVGCPNGCFTKGYTSKQGAIGHCNRNYTCCKCGARTVYIGEKVNA